MNETLDPNTAHSELILSEGNERVAHRRSRNQTSYSDLTASSLRWARRGSSQEGGYKKRRLGTGQYGSWVLPRMVSWRSHLCVNWEWVRAVSCYGNEYWAISSPLSLCFLKMSLGQVRISLDYTSGCLSFYNMNKCLIYTPLIFFSEILHPLHSLVPYCRFSWHFPCT